MLVITRRPGEAVHIGPDVVVTVLRVKGNHIHIGIAAPKETKILREELLDRPAPPEAA